MTIKSQTAGEFARFTPQAYHTRIHQSDNQQTKRYYSTMRVVLTGGGTGGHLVPFEPIIETLRTVHREQQEQLPAQREPAKLEIYFLGVATKAARTLFKHYDIHVIHIPSGKLRRYASAATPLDLGVRLPLGILKALIDLWLLMPDVVISKGGYGSVPVVLAATVYRIPILLHESDVIPGVANKLMAHVATTIAVGFAATRGYLAAFKRKTVVTGTPVRSELDRIRPAEAKQSFGFASTDTVVLIMGGSQGAQQLNETVLKVLPALITEVAMIHVTGEKNFQAVSHVAEELLRNSSHREKYKVLSHLTDTMPAALVAADIIVARAGATTLAEIAHLKKPALIIPLASAAGDHQRANAAVLEQAGAVRILDPTNLGENLFKHSIHELISDTKVRTELAQHLAPFDYPRAARTISELAFSLANGIVPQYNEETAQQ